MLSLACAGPTRGNGGSGGASGGSGGASGGSGGASGGSGGGGGEGGASLGGTSGTAAGTGGASGSGGSSNSGGSIGTGGETSGGGASGPDAPISTGGSTGAGASSSRTGGATGAGGISGSGGAGGAGGAGASSGGSRAGGAGGAGGAIDTGGVTGSGGAVDAGPPPIVYALPPPNQSINQWNIPGCQPGVATSPGGGNCTPGQNACEGTKQGAQVNFLCPRFMLFSDEMVQAALDDGNAGLNYAVVGHDVETGGIDGTATISCCQCYQLVFSLPENVAQVNGNGASAIPIPPPLVVQSFNTSAGGGQNFDIFMGAGGFGAFNACDPNTSMKSASGKYLYTGFPPEGEPGSGGVNAATQIASCSSRNLVTTASLSSTTCQTDVATACAKFKSSSTTMTNESIRSCTESNDPYSYYHMNWKIYAKRVECPTHLAQVTGCKLASQGLPAVNPKVMTPDQAAADSSFKSGYTTTTMQDCCMPTCAWQNNVGGQGVKTVDNYNTFYSCNQNGDPVTE